MTDYWKGAQGLSKNVSNVLYLYHNKKMKEGQYELPTAHPPPVYFAVNQKSAGIGLTLKYN